MLRAATPRLLSRAMSKQELTRICEMASIDRSLTLDDVNFVLAHVALLGELVEHGVVEDATVAKIKDAIDDLSMKFSLHGLSSAPRDYQSWQRGASPADE